RFARRIVTTARRRLFRAIKGAPSWESCGDRCPTGTGVPSTNEEIADIRCDGLPLDISGDASFLSRLPGVLREKLRTDTSGGNNGFMLRSHRRNGTLSAGPQSLR